MTRLAGSAPPTPGAGETERLRGGGCGLPDDRRVSGVQGPTGAAVISAAVLASISGGGTALVQVVAAAAMGFVAYAFVIFTHGFNSAGSVYGFTGAVTGPRFGFLSAWTLMLVHVSFAGGTYVATADEAQPAFGSLGCRFTGVTSAKHTVGSPRRCGAPVGHLPAALPRRPAAVPADQVYFALAGQASERQLMREIDDVLTHRPALGALADEVEDFRGVLASSTASKATGTLPLTPAQLRLLPYLQTHLTADKIAERLFVSSHTVKTQVKAIYPKLGVSSRNEAVQKATVIAFLSASRSPGRRASSAYPHQGDALAPPASRP